jgi:hypothetical protein
MSIYLLKSILCFAILLAFYKVALESLSIHKFKRFYLLAILPCAFIIPSITFTTYIEPVLDFGTYDPTSGMTPPYFPAEMVIEEEPTNYLPIILWSFYSLGASIFAIKFCRNLYKITSRIKSHQKVKTRSFINVLIQKLTVPHTFFYYIFLNKEAFENQQIPKEVLLHEETHAKQLHSIDILLIELFQILFWFNPLIYFYKKSIKLNHEFLADAAVLDQGISKPEYQNILLAFSSNAHQPLANAINYSLIKKRFTVMKTQSSKTSIWIRSTLLLPSLDILLFSFSNKKEVIKDIKTNNNTEVNPFIVSLEKNNNSVILKCNDGCKWANITLDFDAKSQYIINDYGFSNGKTLATDKFAFTVQNIDSEIKLTSLKGTKWNDLNFSLLNNKKEFFNQTGISSSKKFNKNEPKGKGFSVKAINNKLTINNISHDVENYAKILNSITKTWTVEDYKKAVPELEIHNCSQDFLDKLDAQFRKTDYFSITIQGVQTFNNTEDLKEKRENFQEGATKAQIKEYNALASKYNNMDKSNMLILSKDVARVKYLYNLMSYKQRKNAEPFPDFPEPPPAPNAPNTDNFPPPPPPIPENATPLEKDKYKEVIADYEAWRKKHTYKAVNNNTGEEIEFVINDEVAQNPPPPPPPKSPLDHVVAMAKKNATFYLEGKQISSDEAIKALKSDKDLNIATQKQNSNAPKVYISTQPITTNKKGELVTKAKTLKEVKSTLNEDDQGYVTINGSTYFFIIRNNKVKYFDRWGQRVDETGKAIHPAKVKRKKENFPKQTAEATNRSKDNKAHEIYEKYKDTHPAYRHLRTTTDKTITENVDATFYYNDERISQKKAKNLVDKNSNINIQYIDENSKNPIVYITDRPLKINNNNSIPKPNANTIVNHIKVMNRHKADFYLDNEKISYKKALKYVKANRDADVHSSLESGVVVIKTK